MTPGQRAFRVILRNALAAALLASVWLFGASARAEQPAELTSDQRNDLYEQLARQVSALEEGSRALKTVVRLVSPTVVHIESEKKDRWSRQSGGKRYVEEAGSGVIIKLKGSFFALTNWHVVKDADLKHIKVNLADGRQMIPTQLWRDPETDIAVLALDDAHLIPARLGDSDELEIGDFVIAVGSPFGLSHSVTFGIISAKGRRDLELGEEGLRFQDFIQTDTAINPGNSGGPLINLHGEVVGINTAIASNSGGNEGIGFSIPINMAMTIARQLVEQGKVVRAFLGVQLSRRFGAAEAAELGLSAPRGALINGITPNSPAANANLKVGDLILRFNGVLIEDDAHLQNVVSLTEAGKEVPVIVLRDRQEVSLPVRVGDRTQFEPRSEAELPGEFSDEQGN
jgi:serine protease Do